jgi:AraC-like DNA-binding protein
MTFQSAEENEEFLLRMDVNQEMRQLRRGPFRSDFTWRATGTAELYADRFSSACRMYLEPTPGAIGLLWLRSAGAPLLASGVDAANDKLLFLPRNTVVDLVLPDLAGSEVIGLPEERFREMLSANCPDCEPLEHLTLMEGNPAEIQKLSRHILSLLNEPGGELPSEWISNLLAATLCWISESTEQRPPGKLQYRPVHRQIARKAEEYICEHYRDAVHIEDICRETGVGLRTLQRCVRKYFDVTVTELIESVRMNSAHRELSELRPEESTVTQVALDNGFSHLGRFSVAYRERYGETPSDRLAHLAGQKT